MEKELSHSFNIVLDKKVSDRLKKIQNLLTKKFSEQRFYDSSPHASILNKFMGVSKTKDLVKVLLAEFENDKVWEMGFSTLTPSDNGTYIFLNFSRETAKKMIEINKRSIKCTKGIGFEGQGGQTKPKYPYIPHISMIKLEDQEVAEAVKLIKDDLDGLKMPVKKYEITVQKDDKKGFSTFPIVCEIELK